MTFTIKEWQEIKDNYNGTIILGNGASMAIDSKFGYGSLFDKANVDKRFDDEIIQISDFFRSKDFEFLLRILWQTNNVNNALSITDNQTKQAYENIRDSLIQTVKDIHPMNFDITNKFQKIYDFLKGFKTVLSLNYDLIIYWALMYGNENPENNTNQLKDCFISERFKNDWESLREVYKGRKSTLVFYPHGNLALARDKTENEIKLSNMWQGNINLLDTITDKWKNDDYVPIFVSEGTKEEKIKSIGNSNYLSTVYYEVLTGLKADNLVIYGWSISEQDFHILEQIKKASSIRQIAVSVYENNQDFCNTVSLTLNKYFSQNCQIEFFNSASSNCWCY